MKVDLSASDEIPAEGSRHVDFFGRGVHVLRAADGRAHAFADVCPHFGGPLECRDGVFECAWHGATFERDTGRRLSGPAAPGSRLMRLSTVEEEGRLRYVWGEEG